MSSKTSTVTPVVEAPEDTGGKPGHGFQVILYNDDVNLAEYVVTCLVRIFGHPAALATKIMLEAHRTGRAIAQVEAEGPAREHAAQLHASGLRATVEPIA